MAKVKKAKGKKGVAGKKKKTSVFGKPEVTLPTEPSTLSHWITDYSMFVHGEKKIGKTTLLAQEPGSLFLEWDPEQKALAILQRHVGSWPEMLAYLTALEARRDNMPYKTIVVDGVDLMYQTCFQWKCKQLGISHPHDENDFGRSWDAIRNEFSDAVRRLINLGLAPRFITHSQWKEVKQRGGGKLQKLLPNLKGQAEEILDGLVDIWAAYCYDGPHRVLVIRGDETTGAGHRVDHCFRTPDGEQVGEIPMGKSAEEGYANFLKAFRNEWPFVTLADYRAARRKGVKGKRKIRRVKRK